MVWTFPDSAEARDRAARSADIIDEIHTIRAAIDTAIASKAFEAVVEDATMAGDSAYHAAWSGTADDEPRRYAMESVIAHFRALGYTIVREQDPVNVAKFRWRISW